MLSKKLKTKIYKGSKISEETLQEMWSLRLTMMSLKPEISLDFDYMKFSSFCKRCAFIPVFKDKQGKIQGFYAIFELKLNNRSFAIMPEYGFMASDYRGHPAILLSFLPYFFTVSWRMFHQNLYMVCIGYPTAYCMLGRYWDSIQTPKSHDIEPELHQNFQELIKFACESDFDTDTGWVKMRTIPKPLSKSWYQYNEPTVTYQNYLKLNPNWKEGYGVVFGGKISITAFCRLIIKIIKRATHL